MSGKGERISIVEDDRAIAAELKLLLEQWGYEASCVEDFRAVSEEIRTYEPRLILMDVGLPYYNGYYWCSEIRRFSTVPIVFLSSASDAMNIVMAMDMGGDDFIAKPFDAAVLMAYLRLEESESDYVFRTVELDELLRGCIRRFSGEFISRRLHLHYEPTDKSIVTDEKWLAFVVEQLLSNAVKYTREGGVTVSITENELCIRDTGAGIPPEDLPRIFEKGYTGANGRRDKRASGIGLYLCRRICDKLGLGLRCESVLHEGTSMVIELGKCDRTVSE